MQPDASLAAGRHGRNLTDVAVVDLQRPFDYVDARDSESMST